MAEMNSTENAKKQKTVMLVAQVSDHQMRIEVLEGEKELLRMEMESFKTVAETYEKCLETAIDRLDKQARLIGGLQDLASELQAQNSYLARPSPFEIFSYLMLRRA
ncbi:hypothetical protein SCP_1104040 [Sparassis crispa]|uniref:Uncharacterized protein n=1 Tax=Sparassis crispa TaxID=139825 RepID=A0A401GZX7_9APHY|nr:hypothetical protein SCP_1104040 [Sparassis crispa]GBE87727.1 hypothetical protein SCP_1104040 [Sparassis crispa]